MQYERSQQSQVEWSRIQEYATECKEQNVTNDVVNSRQVPLSQRLPGLRPVAGWVRASLVTALPSWRGAAACTPTSWRASTGSTLPGSRASMSFWQMRWGWARPSSPLLSWQPSGMHSLQSSLSSALFAYIGQNHSVHCLPGSPQVCILAVVTDLFCLLFCNLWVAAVCTLMTACRLS